MVAKPEPPNRSATPAHTDLEEVLKQLPRVEARPGMALRALSEVRRRRRQRADRRHALWHWLDWRVPAALVAAALMGFVLAPLLRHESGDSRQPAAVASIEPEHHEGPQDVEALRAEVQRVQGELAFLKELARARTPLVHIEGREADYLVDPRDFVPARWPSSSQPGDLP